jgi:hypothetical protein
MGQYKVPQNVEAEDKIIGFLTMKQFIYAIIGVSWGLLSYTLLRQVPVLFVLVGIPPALLFLLLGLYQRQDQPFEVYLLALVSYLVRPRKRVWEKEPIVEVFKVEAPKVKPTMAVRNPDEVRGQLDRLAHIVDTRGFSAKQPALQEPDAEIALDHDDRLTSPAIEPAPSVTLASDIDLSDDMLDLQNNPSAQELNALIQDSEQHIREEALKKMKQHQAANPTHVPTNSPSSTPQTQPAVPPPTQLPATNQASGGQSTSVMTHNPIADILKLAMENSDLTVSQIERQAERQTQRQATLSEGETANLRSSSNPS